MFHKILVAIDSSENGQRVLGQAIDLAKTTEADLMLLHVLSGEEEGSPNFFMAGLEYYPVITNEIAEMYQRQWTEYKNRGLEMLRSYAEQASTDGVKAEFSQNMGSPGRTICDIARTWQADLIVIGRRGHSGFNELLLGSVSNYVLHHAPCSVLTVQGEEIYTDSTVASDEQTVVMP